MSTAFWKQATELDQDQRQAVESVMQDESFLLKGPAGSGKTNILLLRAKWLTLKQQSNLKIIVFTASLRAFIEEGCSEYGLDPNIAVTQMTFFKTLLQEHSVPVELTGSFEEDRSLLAGKVRSLVESGKVSTEYCSAILVDEAQDYTDTELLVFRALTKRLILASDTRQSIYKATHTPGLPEKLVNEKVIALRFHYRSGLTLCKVADGILADSAAYPRVQKECQYPEETLPSSVSVFPADDFQKQIDQILVNVEPQLALYPQERIGVLFPKREQVSAFIEALMRSNIPDISERVWTDTLHGAKGLEFRAVHLAGLEDLNRMGPTQKRLAYTGVLRGKTSASLYYTGHIPGYLDSALARLKPPAANPVFDSLFKT